MVDPRSPDNPGDLASSGTRNPSDSDRQERLASRNWIVVELFDMATTLELHSPGWEPFQELVEQTTGTRIPAGTMKYWANGHSTPKVSEVELMAQALGYELDLHLKEENEE